MTTRAERLASSLKEIAEEVGKPMRRMVNVPTNASQDYVRMFHALKRLAAGGCSRLVPPSTCRREPGGYPNQEWCEGCIAAEGLGLDRDWFQLR